MAFFVQRRVQPLQHRLSKLWNYSGLVDSSRVSKDLIEKQDVNKRVRALTKLTKDHAVADLAANYFDPEHPLPEVCSSYIIDFCLFHHLHSVFLLVFMILLTYSFAGPPVPRFMPSPSRGGPLPVDLASAVSEAPEAEENQDGDDAEGSEDETSSTTSPPLALSEDLVVDKKRKRVEELASSSTSVQRTAAGEASV
jgi:hypothetical protein